MQLVTHLHVHTHYTLLGATPSVRALATRAAKEGMTHLAITDTNVLYGAVVFSQACQRMAIQPIIGMTLTVRPPALPEDDPKTRQPDISRAKSILSWEPKVSVEKGLRQTIDWYRARSG